MEFYNLKSPDTKGEDFNFKQLENKIVLIVNVASKCGFTPQYKDLQTLYSKYKDSGFIILGFPCNQFAWQEPGTNEEIQSFCQLNYGVEFPVLGKVDVNGSDESPVFHFLKQEKPGLLGVKAIKWNFTKFLVDRNGKVVERYAPNTKPLDISPDIEKLI